MCTHVFVSRGEWLPGHRLVGYMFEATPVPVLMLVPVILLMASRGGYLRLLMIAVAIRVMMTTIVLMLVLTRMVTAVRRRGTVSVVKLLADSVG